MSGDREEPAVWNAIIGAHTEMKRGSLLRMTRPVGLLVLAAVVVFAFWFRGPQLEVFTSPPLTVKGTTIRLQGLVPEGWTTWPVVTKSSYAIPAGVPNMPSGHRDSYLITLRPSGRLKWLPSFIRGYFVRPTDPEDRLAIDWPDADGPGIEQMRTAVFIPGEYAVYVAVRDWKAKFSSRIVYARANRAEFEATYRQICESFKVIE
jgi:hypothetical protein